MRLRASPAEMLLIMTLIGGGLPELPFLSEISTACVLLGFVLVIAAAIQVIRENSIIQRAVNAELLDIPELAEGTGQPAGAVSDPGRGRKA